MHCSVKEQGMKDIAEALAAFEGLAEFARKTIMEKMGIDSTRGCMATSASAISPAHDVDSGNTAAQLKYKTQHPEYQPALKNPSVVQALLEFHNLTQPMRRPVSESADAAAPAFTTSDVPVVNAIPKTSSLNRKKAGPLTSTILRP